MNYDEEEVLSDSGFNPNGEPDDLDGDPLFDESLDEEETSGFKFDEEETDSI